MAERVSEAYADYKTLMQSAPGVKVNLADLARRHNIPYNTLKAQISNGGKPLELGRGTSLPTIVEKRLAELIEYRFKFGKSLEWQEVRHCAKLIAKSLLDVVGPNEKLEEFKASEKWLKGFCMRYDAVVTSRKPELVSIGRAAAANPHSIRNEIETRIRALEMVDQLNGGPGVAENVPPERKWNTDESGFSATSSRKHVAVPTGYIDCTTVGEDHGEKVSAALLVSAAGHAAAPYYILPGVRKVAANLDDNGKLVGTHRNSGNNE